MNLKNETLYSASLIKFVFNAILDYAFYMAGVISVKLFVTSLEAVRFVAGVAVPSNLSAARAPCKWTQVPKQCCTTSQSFTASFALGAIPVALYRWI